MICISHSYHFSKDTKNHTTVFRLCGYQHMLMSVTPIVPAPSNSIFIRHDVPEKLLNKLQSPMSPSNVRNIPIPRPKTFKISKSMVPPGKVYHNCLLYSKCILSVSDSISCFSRGYFFKSGSSVTSFRASVRLASTSLIFCIASIARSPTPHCFCP